MNTWPSHIRYQKSGSSISVEPDVSRNTTATGHAQQRVLSRDRDDVFNVSSRMSGTQLAVFKQFITDNPSWFLGPYFDCDFEQTGVLRVLNNSYSAKAIKNDVFLVSWQIEVQDRSTEIGEILFDMASELGADLYTLKNIAGLLAKAVNENNL